eukprot:scaffold14562_cov60-Phaeocystis_antarctica.AAC.3
MSPRGTWNKTPVLHHLESGYAHTRFIPDNNVTKNTGNPEAQITCAGSRDSRDDRRSRTRRGSPVAVRAPAARPVISRYSGRRR